jgi:hypothetical protein
MRMTFEGSDVREAAERNQFVLKSVVAKYGEN